MSTTGRRGSRIWLGLPVMMVVAALTAGCGRKGPPVPLQEAVPAAITDLRYAVVDNTVTLIWSYPDKTAGGDELPAIARFEILSATVPEKDYCPGCPVAFGPAIDIAGGPVTADAGGRYPLTDLKPDCRYFYKVRSKTGWKQVSRDSNQVSFVWRADGVVVP